MRLRPRATGAGMTTINANSGLPDDGTAHAETITRP